MKSSSTHALQHSQNRCVGPTAFKGTTEGNSAAAAHRWDVLCLHDMESRLNPAKQPSPVADCACYFQAGKEMGDLP